MRERNGGRSPLGGQLVGGGDIYDEQLFLPVVEKMSRGRLIFSSVRTSATKHYR
jgi:hypothetical protein